MNLRANILQHLTVQSIVHSKLHSHTSIDLPNRLHTEDPKINIIRNPFRCHIPQLKHLINNLNQVRVRLLSRLILRMRLHHWRLQRFNLTDRLKRFKVQIRELLPQVSLSNLYVKSRQSFLSNGIISRVDMTFEQFYSFEGFIKMILNQGLHA